MEELENKEKTMDLNNSMNSSTLSVSKMKPSKKNGNYYEFKEYNNDAENLSIEKNITNKNRKNSFDDFNDIFASKSQISKPVSSKNSKFKRKSQFDDIFKNQSEININKSGYNNQNTRGNIKKNQSSLFQYNKKAFTKSDNNSFQLSSLNQIVEIKNKDKMTSQANSEDLLALDFDMNLDKNDKYEVFNILK